MQAIEDSAVWMLMNISAQRSYIDFMIIYSTSAQPTDTCNLSVYDVVRSYDLTQSYTLGGVAGTSGTLCQENT